MPKATDTSASPDVKPDPYPKSSPAKKPSSPTKGTVFNDEMDRKIITHVLKNSDINLRYNWKALIDSEFPHMNTKQVSYQERFRFVSANRVDIFS